MKKSDRYLKVVEWSEEDGCYIGTCPGLMAAGVHGDDGIEVQEQDEDELPPGTAGREYSGKFVLRVGEDLHKLLTIQALKEGESLNRLCNRLLREATPPYESGD